jgi:hypothetical protein
MRGTDDGPRALVRALMRRGLPREQAPAAAALVLALNQWCAETPRGPLGLPVRRP